jgi:hypothetical protein
MLLLLRPLLLRAPTLATGRAAASQWIGLYPCRGVVVAVLPHSQSALLQSALLRTSAGKPKWRRPLRRIAPRRCRPSQELAGVRSGAARNFESEQCAKQPPSQHNPRWTATAVLTLVEKLGQRSTGWGGVAGVQRRLRLPQDVIRDSLPTFCRVSGS